MSTTTHAAPAAKAPQSVEALRLVVANQPTVFLSIAALVQGIAAALHAAADANDAAAVGKMSDQIGADPKAWVDAVMANTAFATQTADAFVAVPSYVALMTPPPKAPSAAAAPH